MTPAGVRVQVLNGTEEKGVATEATDALVAAGFTAEDPTDADPLAATIVRFAPGKTVEAQLVGRYLAGPTLFEEVPEQTVDIVVVAGANFRGVRTSPKPKSEVQEPDGSAPTTTTTAPAVDASLPDFVPDVPPEGMDCP